MFLVTLGPAPAFEPINLQELWNIGRACEEGKTVTESVVIQGPFCQISPRQSVRGERPSVCCVFGRFGATEL